MYVKLLILSLISVVVSEKVRYDNYALYKVHPKTEDEVKFLKDLYKSDDDLDFWVPPSRAGEFVSVVAPPEKKQEFEHTLAKRSIFSHITLDNIQEAFNSQLYSRKRRDTRKELFWTAYQTLEDIYEWFEYLAETYPDVVSLISVGTSHQGRNITGIKVSRSSNNRIFLLGGGQVGADWLSPTVLTYIVDQLVKGEYPEALAASLEFEWHIIPVFNPDGFQYSQDADRLWVKNRRQITIGAVGIDLTKNWNSQWGVSGGSFNPASNNFIGLGPFSEPETRALSRYIESIGSRLTGFLTFRSFGQRMTIPFAHTSTPMYNFNETIIISRRALGSLAVRYNTQYIAGISRDIHDGATGNVEDWVKFRFNPPIAGGLYLRDTGTFGYTLPVAQVKPSCEETFDLLMALIREARFMNVV